MPSAAPTQIFFASAVDITSTAHCSVEPINTTSIQVKVDLEMKPNVRGQREV
jgi:hypothetical protein